MPAKMIDINANNLAAVNISWTFMDNFVDTQFITVKIPTNIGKQMEWEIY